MIAAIDIVAAPDPVPANPAADTSANESGFGAILASLGGGAPVDADVPPPPEVIDPQSDDEPTLVLDLIALLTGVPTIPAAVALTGASAATAQKESATSLDADAPTQVAPSLVGDRAIGSTAPPVVATGPELISGQKAAALKPPSDRHSGEGRNPATLQVPTPEPATQLGSGLRRNDEVAESRSTLVPPAPLAGSAPAVSTRADAQTVAAPATLPLPLPTPTSSLDLSRLAATPMSADATTLVGALPAAATPIATPASPTVPALPVVVAAASAGLMRDATPPTWSSRVAAADVVKLEPSPTAGVVTPAPAQLTTLTPVFAAPASSPALATPAAPATAPVPLLAAAPTHEPAPRLAATVTDGSFDVATDRLGPVSVRLDAGEARLSVEFTVDRSVSAALLGAQGDRLEAAVAAQGARLDALSVDVRGGNDRRPPPSAAATVPVPQPRSTPTAAARPRDRFA